VRCGVAAGSMLASVPTEGRTGKTENCACSHILLGLAAVSVQMRRTEFAMNTINWDLRNLTAQTHSGLCWSDIKRQLVDWQHNIRSRNELESLDDRCLQDIGISRGTTSLEAAKPFWMS
jgi:uncharacterized protein YjiS (DUF1127 family)